MKRLFWIAFVSLAALAGCGGDDRKAIPPAGPMTPPGPNSEGEGSAGGKGKERNKEKEKTATVSADG